MTEPEPIDGVSRDATANAGPLRAGTRFLKYDVLRLIGRGSYTFVYEAHDSFLDAAVAIKVIPDLAHVAAGAAKRAQAEGRRLAQVEHAGIARVHDAGVAENELIYLVLERLGGRTLRAALDDLRRLTPLEALEVAVEVADAVEAAHRAGVLHRDLKPDNIFIEPGNHVKVVDFGFARVLGHADDGQRADRLAGTLLYMAPELLKGLAPSPQSDVFSLGTLLYECLHRHPTLIGVEDATLELAGRLQIEAMPPPLDLLEPGVPAHVARFVQRAILKQPTERYASMGELATAARAALERLREDAVPLERRDLSGARPDDAGETSPRPSSARRIPVPKRPLMPGVPVASLKRPGEATERALVEPPSATVVRDAAFGPRPSPSPSPLRVAAALLGFAVLTALGMLAGFAFFDAPVREPTPARSPRATPPASPHERSRRSVEPQRSGGSAGPVRATGAESERAATASAGRKPVPAPTPRSAATLPAPSGKTAMDERLEWLRTDLGASSAPRVPPPNKQSSDEKAAPSKSSASSILE